MAVTYRPCIVCHQLMACSRANKYCCSNLCHSKMHKRRAKLGLSTREMIALLKDELLEAQENQEN